MKASSYSPLVIMFMYMYMRIHIILIMYIHMHVHVYVIMYAYQCVHTCTCSCELSIARLQLFATKTCFAVLIYCFVVEHQCSSLPWALHPWGWLCHVAPHLCRDMYRCVQEKAFIRCLDQDHKERKLVQLCFTIFSRLPRVSNTQVSAVQMSN